MSLAAHQFVWNEKPAKKRDPGALRLDDAVAQHVARNNSATSKPEKKSDTGYVTTIAKLDGYVTKEEFKALLKRVEALEVGSPPKRDRAAYMRERRAAAKVQG